MRSPTDGDRLVIRADHPPRAWCRKCRQTFWPNEEEDWTPAEIQRRKLIYLWEREVEESVQHRNTEEKRERLLKSGTWLRMHDAAVTSEDAIAEWKQALFDGADIDPMPLITKYSLGWMDMYVGRGVESPALSIPFWGPHSKLLTIQYRLINMTTDKYRFEPGLSSTMFLTRPDEYGKAGDVLVVEGAKKAMVVAMFMPEWDVIGMPSKTMPIRLLEALKPYRAAYFALDPDAHECEPGEETAVERAIMHSKAKENYIVDVPAKPDDMFTVYGATRRDLQDMIKVARR